MNNTINCPNCNEDNPFYQSKCLKCNSFLRDKVANINLWETISQLIESPVEAFSKIIRSEHKNFVAVILFFSSLKIFIDSIFLMMYVNKQAGVFDSIILQEAIILGILIIEVISISFIIKIVTGLFGLRTRLKDNFSILIYSLTPHALAICILFPIELVVFGTQLFSTNPSPFVLRETIAYIIFGIEGIIILWAIFLAAAAIYAQTRSLFFAIITGILFNGIILYSLYVLDTII